MHQRCAGGPGRPTLACVVRTSWTVERGRRAGQRGHLLAAAPEAEPPKFQQYDVVLDTRGQGRHTSAVPDMSRYAKVGIALSCSDQSPYQVTVTDAAGDRVGYTASGSCLAPPSTFATSAAFGAGKLPRTVSVAVSGTTRYDLTLFGVPKAAS